MISITAEAPTYFEDISSLLRDAFDGLDEVALVNELRERGDVACAFVAVEEGSVAGHVMFSRLSAAIDGKSLEGVALAPLAVRPDCRNQGVGAGLVREGLNRSRLLGYGFAAVVGDPAYYGRFGFSAAAANGLQSPFSGPYLQVVALVPGALGKGLGTLTYAAPFERFS